MERAIRRIIAVEHIGHGTARVILDDGSELGGLSEVSTHAQTSSPPQCTLTAFMSTLGRGAKEPT